MISTFSQQHHLLQQPPTWFGLHQAKEGLFGALQPQRRSQKEPLSEGVLLPSSKVTMAKQRSCPGPRRG